MKLNQWKRNSKLFFDEAFINFYYLRETYGFFFVTFNRAEQWRLFYNNLLYVVRHPSSRMKWLNPRFSPAVQRRSAVNSSSSIGSTRARNEPQNYDIVSSIVSLFASCVSDSNSLAAASNLPTLTMQLGKYYQGESRLNWISSYRAFRGAASYSAFTSKT